MDKKFKNNTPKSRLMQRLKSGLSIVAICLAYYGFTKITGWGIPCVFNKLFHIYCPGCGLTRMFLSLFSGDIRAAAGYNLFALVFLIPVVIFISVRTVRFVRSGDTKYNNIENTLIIFTFICGILFAVLRNLPHFSFLAP